MTPFGFPLPRRQYPPMPIAVPVDVFDREARAQVADRSGGELLSSEEADELLLADVLVYGEGA